MLNDSDSPLETICRSIVDAVVIADASKNFVFWNDSARQLLATGPDDVDPEVWARHFRLYYVNTEENLKYEDLPMIRALAGETYSDFRVMTKNPNHPDGIILSVNGKPIMEKGQIVGAFTTFRDITESVKAENKTSFERAFFLNVLDLLPNIVCIKDLKGHFIFTNKTFLEFVGVPREAVFGKTMDAFLAPEVALKIKANEARVIKEQKALDFEETIILNGKKSIFMSTRFPFFDEKGVMTGVCGVMKDVTKELNAKMEIEQERNKTAHISKLAAIGILAAEIAHEIKNPLTIMRTNNDVIRYALKDEKIDFPFVNMKMNTQNDTIDRMDRVASSLSNLSKDASRELPMKFFLEELLEDVGGLISFRTRKMGIEIEISSECGKTELLANRVQLSEVVLNLVVNALDATEHISNPKVSIHCKKTSGVVMIRVYDNGPGVDEEIRNKIFEPFYTTKDLEKGTGLGLSISKKIVQQHKGDIYYDIDELGHCFVVCLPFTST